MVGWCNCESRSRCGGHEQNFDHAGAARDSPADTPDDGLDDAAGRIQLLDELGNVRVAAHGGEVREDAVPVPGVAEGQQEQGDAVGKGGGDAREGVLRARAVLHSEHAWRTAVGNAGIAVTDAHADALLPAYDGPNPNIGGRLYDGRRGEHAE